jgi:hypothetical protein
MTAAENIMAIGSESKRCGRSVGALVLAALLAACAGTDMAGLVTPAAAPEPAPAATPAPDPTPAAPARTRASRQEPAPAPAPATAQPSAKLTTEQINTECWMRADSDRRLRDIDARLAYVKKCVAERTKGR